MNAEARIRAVVEAWFITEPLLFLAWMTHQLVPRPGIPTLRVGERRVEYNPDFINALPDKALREVVRIEAIRVVLRHPYSRRPPDPKIAWLASNITLHEHVPTRLPLPSAREVLGHTGHEGQYYEYYCDRLAEHTQGGRPTQGGDDGALGTHFSDGEANAQLWQEDALVQEEIKGLIREAAATNGWGNLSHSLQSHILATLKPKIDYRRILRQFHASILSSHRELTRMRPSRRYGFDYMGSRYRLQSRLLIAVDVSGSISDAEINLAFSVVNQLFRYGVETIDTLQFDTLVTGPVQRLQKAQHKVKVKGRGGTDFSPVLAYIDAHPEYDGLIIITDGCAPPPKPPKNRHTQVLWLFNHESVYTKMHRNVAAIGRVAWIKSGSAPSTREPQGPTRP